MICKNCRKELESRTKIKSLNAKVVFIGVALRHIIRMKVKMRYGGTSI
jgi:hypothetical protein